MPNQTRVYVTDERDGLKESLENSKDLLQKSKNDETNLLGQVQALQHQVQALSSAKEEVCLSRGISQHTLLLCMRFVPLSSNSLHSYIWECCFGFCVSQLATAT